MIRMRFAVLGLCLTAAAGCQRKPQPTVKVDGSSTVAPITQVAAELFSTDHPEIQVTVGISGTGGGFKKFLDANAALRTDINDASRAIKSQEIEAAQKLGIEFVELPIALDGIAVMVHPSNAFCDFLTVDELKRIWEPGSKINNWKDVRAGFPDLPLKLYGPGNDSGTFDYFTEAIVGKEKASRSDYSANENDNVLVQGIQGDPGALGYFGLAYYEANEKNLKLVGVSPGEGKPPVKPTIDTVRDGSYQPLSRPLFLYINRGALDRAEVRTFVEFYLAHAKEIVVHPNVRYITLSDAIYEAARNRLKNKTTGTAMAGSHAATAADLAKAYAAP